MIHEIKAKTILNHTKNPFSWFECLVLTSYQKTKKTPEGPLMC